MNNSNEDEISGLDSSLFKNGVLVDYKAEYIKQPKNYSNQDTKDCLICRIIEKDDSVPRYEVYRDDLIIVFLNLYPYQVGHLLVSPLRHIMGYEEYSIKEIIALGLMLQKCIEMVSHFGGTESFNVGWNQGKLSGGSIKHHHAHLVPRYPNELNFYEIIAKTKPIIQALDSTHTFLLQYQDFLSGNKEINELNIQSFWSQK